MANLLEGDAAPDFDMPGEEGQIRLSALRGQTVVVYFYPKDDTTGCTAEALDFSRLAGRFAAAGAVVIGISPDSVRKHQRFRQKHGLTVQLGADEDHAIATAYGCWGEKTMYGRSFMGIVRSTFLIDRTGRIARLWRNVRVKGHAEAVLEAAAGLAKA